ncbi:Rab11 family-interacting protein 3, partial [Galemys pyrenaicus]
GRARSRARAPARAARAPLARPPAPPPPGCPRPERPERLCLPPAPRGPRAGAAPLSMEPGAPAARAPRLPPGPPEPLASRAPGAGPGLNAGRAAGPGGGGRAPAPDGAARPDPETDPDPELDPAPGRDSDPELPPEPEPDPGPGLEPEPEPHSDPEPEPEPGALFPWTPAPRPDGDPRCPAGASFHVRGCGCQAPPEVALFPAFAPPAGDELALQVGPADPGRPPDRGQARLPAREPAGRAEDCPRLRAVFEALDGDGDGLVRTEDFVQFATVYGAEQVQDLTRYLDPGRLGVISFEDFYRGISAIRNGDPEGQLCGIPPAQEEEPPACPDDFDDFITYEATEVTDSAYMGSEGTFSECETFTDEDTSALVQPELQPEGDADSAGGSAVASEGLDGAEELGQGALLLLPGRPHLLGQPGLAAAVGCEEHFEDFGEGGETEPCAEVLCNGDQACRDSALRTPSTAPLAAKLHTMLADEAFEFYCSQCHRQVTRLEDLSARLNDLEMNSPSKRLSSRKVARHLLQSGTLPGEALQDAPLDAGEGVVFLEKRVSELERDTAASGGQHSRLRQENLQLVHRAHALEEQLKEQELRACEAALEGTRRQRELLCRLEREKSLEIESLQARLQQLDEENSELRSCTPCLKASIQRLEEEKQKLLDEIEELSLRLSEEQATKRRLGARLSQERHQFQRDKEATQELIEDLRRQLEQLQLFKLEAEQRRGTSSSVGLQEYQSRAREGELEQEVRRLKQVRRGGLEQEVHRLKQVRGGRAGAGGAPAEAGARGASWSR